MSSLTAEKFKSFFKKIFMMGFYVIPDIKIRQ